MAEIHQWAATGEVDPDDRSETIVNQFLDGIRARWPASSRASHWCSGDDFCQRCGGAIRSTTRPSHLRGRSRV
jgi:hypothetical protein